MYELRSEWDYGGRIEVDLVYVDVVATKQRCEISTSKQAGEHGQWNKNASASFNTSIVALSQWHIC